MSNDNSDLEYLMGPIAIPEAEKELRDWLKKNRDFLRRHCDSPAEVALYAIRYGAFDPATVYHVTSHAQDLFQDSHVESRTRFEMWRWQEAFQSTQQLKHEQELKVKRASGLDLSALWQDLCAYQTGEAA